jgi:hypothetical protein
MRVERMRKLRLRNVEQLPIPDYLPGVTVNAQHKQLLSVLARGGQPDLLSVNHGRRPTPVVNRGLPDDIPRLAPVQRQAARVRMPRAVGPAKLRPILASVDQRTRRHQQKDGEDLRHRTSLTDYPTQPRSTRVQPRHSHLDGIVARPRSNSARGPRTVRLRCRSVARSGRLVG